MDIIEHVSNLIKHHVPYKKEPPFSLEEGFNCYAWVAFIRNQLVNDIYLPETITDLRPLLQGFKRIYENPQYLDISMCYLGSLEERHVGLMLDNTYMTQCNSVTNGVSICNVTKQPWKFMIKRFYRFKCDL
jgi:hypothetical protein